MKPADYITGVKKTEPKPTDYEKIHDNISLEDMHLLLALMNRQVHLGNQIGALKKKIFYGDKRPKVTDEVKNAKTEHGYLMKYFESYRYAHNNLAPLKFMRLLHGIMGKSDEVGELNSAFLFYLKTGRLDEVNMKEELGDDGWYTGITVDALETTFESIWAANNRKLLGTENEEGRYKNGFSSKDAVNRNLKRERKLLES